MRHNKKNTTTFGLKAGPRKALVRGLVYSLVEHERVKTTLQRARVIRPLVEKAITLGKKGDLKAYRLLLSRYSRKTVVSKIVNDLSKRFKDRPGGYTRIVKLGFRPGDSSPKALIEFVDYQFTPAPTQEEKDKQKASKEYNQKRKTLALKRDKHKKSKRKIQTQSRKTNR